MSFFDKIFGDSNPKDTPQNGLEWNDLTNWKQLDEIVAESEHTPVIIFKHSTRCGISRMALKGFESGYRLPQARAKMYFLDLLNHRDISNAIAERFGVYHESPQLLLIQKGKAIYHTSHGDISAEAVQDEINNE